MIKFFLINLFCYVSVSASAKIANSGKTENEISFNGSCIFLGEINPYELSCNQYYKCEKDGYFWIYFCPYDQLFDILSQTCENGERVDCGERINPYLPRNDLYPSEYENENKNLNNIIYNDYDTDRNVKESTRNSDILVTESNTFRFQSSNKSLLSEQSNETSGTQKGDVEITAFSDDMTELLDDTVQPDSVIMWKWSPRKRPLSSSAAFSTVKDFQTQEDFSKNGTTDYFTHDVSVPVETTFGKQYSSLEEGLNETNEISTGNLIIKDARETSSFSTGNAFSNDTSIFSKVFEMSAENSSISLNTSTNIIKGNITEEEISNFTYGTEHSTNNFSAYDVDSKHSNRYENDNHGYRIEKPIWSYNNTEEIPATNLNKFEHSPSTELHSTMIAADITENVNELFSTNIAATNSTKNQISIKPETFQQHTKIFSSNATDPKTHEPTNHSSYNQSEKSSQEDNIQSYTHFPFNSSHRDDFVKETSTNYTHSAANPGATHEENAANTFSYSSGTTIVRNITTSSDEVDYSIQTQTDLPSTKLIDGIVDRTSTESSKQSTTEADDSSSEEEEKNKSSRNSDESSSYEKEDISKESKEKFDKISPRPGIYLWVAKMKCLGKDYGFYQNPLNCNKYFFCFRSHVIYNYNCPKGFWFDELSVHCKESYKVKCPFKNDFRYKKPRFW